MGEQGSQAEHLTQQQEKGLLAWIRGDIRKTTHLHLPKAASTISASFQATQKTQQPAFSQDVDGASGRRGLVVSTLSHSEGGSLEGTRRKPDARDMPSFSCNLSFPHDGRRRWGQGLRWLCISRLPRSAFCKICSISKAHTLEITESHFPSRNAVPSQDSMAPSSSLPLRGILLSTHDHNGLDQGSFKQGTSLSFDEHSSGIAGGFLLLCQKQPPNSGHFP